MKKYLLLCTALTILSSAHAADLNCVALPDCADLGFSMSESDCAGQFSLKCPFDNTKLFCKKYITKSCAVGDILYNDKKCYEGVPDPADKTPIGVVFYRRSTVPFGGYAVNLVNTSLQWATTTYGGDTGLTKSNDYSVVVADTQSGATKTSTIITTNATVYGSTSAAPGFCNQSTAGGVATGTWILPSMYELSLLNANRTAVATGITNAGGTAITNGRHWTSSEANGTESAWAANPFNCTFSTSAQSGGKYASKQYVRCITTWGNITAIGGDFDAVVTPGNGIVGTLP